jgi:hypothetical protein
MVTRGLAGRITRTASRDQGTFSERTSGTRLRSKGDDMDPAWITAALALCAAVLGTLAWLGRKLWRGFRRTQDFLDDWAGHEERPGVIARPGVMERLQSVEYMLTEVRGQIFPNGGTSMRDDLNAVRRDVADIKQGRR